MAEVRKLPRARLLVSPRLQQEESRLPGEEGIRVLPHEEVEVHLLRDPSHVILQRGHPFDLIRHTVKSKGDRGVVRTTRHT